MDSDRLRAALVGSALAVLGAGALAVVVKLALEVALGGGTDVGIGLPALLLLCLHAAQRVPLVLDGPSVQLGTSGLASGTVSVDVGGSTSWTLPLLGALLVQGVFLARGGARVAAAGGRGWIVGVPFAAACFLLGLVVRPDGLHAAPVHSVVLPLLVGAAFGTLGEHWRSLPVAVDAALRALAVAIGLGSALLVLGLLATLAEDPSLLSRAGFGGVAAVVGLAPLYLPHLGGGAFLLGMDVPLRIAGEGSVGGGAAGGITDVYLFDAGRPWWLLLAPLAPLAACVWGGRRAALAGGYLPTESVGAAALAAVVFVLGAWLLAWYVRLAAAGGLLGAIFEGGIGFDPIRAAVAPLLWAGAGFGIGALVALRGDALRSPAAV